VSGTFVRIAVTSASAAPVAGFVPVTVHVATSGHQTLSWACLANRPEADWKIADVEQHARVVVQLIQGGPATGSAPPARPSWL